MREIIQELLRIESEAQRAVADAEAEARQILADARVQAQKLLEESRRRAAEGAQHLVTELVEQARSQKQGRLDDAKAHNQAAARIPDEPARQAVESICRAVTGTPHAAPPRE